MKLREGEVLVQEIRHTKEIPFRLEDLFTIPIFTINFIILIILLKPSEDSEINNHKELYYYIIVPILISFYLFLTIGRISIRLFKTKSTKFFLTNQRIIFRDLNSEIINESFKLENLILNYKEKANDSGYIIIKKQEEIAKSEETSFISQRGINFFEEKNVIYNIANVKSVFNLIIATKNELTKNK
ncbi:hypothetical protein OIU80_02575 [Flavobacterium sp. LS1R47]|uniref:PH domain-containing protein n=1 Tax=Flavobacterium frigoritolerans TaxID=2987686 RepID=A0A9X2ZKM8_9FLAO|nr:hypothetical protein [Flavobacterium frigoritolerans]MCV9931155.1 hypothetical protein [Flavobacterium frigoritolerans]